MIRFVTATLILTLGLPGCSDATGPTHPPGTFADLLWVSGVFRNSSASHLDLDLPRERTLVGFDESRHSSVAELSGRALWMSTSERVAKIDVCSGDLLLSQEPGAPLGDAGEIVLASVQTVAIDESRGLVYMESARRDGQLGVVALTDDRLEPVAFSGPWRVVPDGMVVVEPNGWLPDGGLVIIASPTDEVRFGAESVVFLAPRSLEVVDSFTAADLGLGQATFLEILVAGGRLILRTTNALVSLDLQTKETVASIPLGVNFLTTANEDGTILVLTHRGDGFDFPGIGVALVFNRDLEQIGVIDISTPLGGQPGTSSGTSAHWAVVDRERPLVYISAGTPGRGPLFGTQTSKIVTADLESFEVVDVHDFGNHRLGRPLLWPCGP